MILKMEKMRLRMVKGKFLPLLTLFLILLAMAGPAIAAEACFIKLGINEDKEGESTLFSLGNVTNLYGNYSGSTIPYNSEIGGHYVLRVLDESGNILQEHALFSSRFTYWDSLEEHPAGETFEEESSGLITSVIPYDGAISRLVVDDAGTETELGFDPNLVECERTCKLEGEFGSYDADESCCLGLIKINKHDGSFVCAKCGDGICSKHEDYYSCFEDCPLDFDSGCSVLGEEGKTYFLDSDVENNSLDEACMRITAPNVTLDCQGHSIRSINAVAGVYSDQPYTTVKNCDIQMGPGGYAAGADALSLLNADNSRILNNNLSNNYRGILVASSRNVFIENNTVNNNAVEGITVYDMTGMDGVDDCTGNVLLNNSFVGNGYFGISVHGCPETNLSENVVGNTKLYGGIEIDGRGSVISGNISVSNNQGGISFSGENLSVSANLACGNNVSGEQGFYDISCGPNSLVSGFDNMFGSFVACGAWPSPEDYAVCSQEVLLVAGNFGSSNCGSCNGADFDSDGDVDVLDLKLALALGSAPLVPDFDLSGDGLVNGDDVLALDAGWGETGCSAVNGWCNGADLDFDGVVGLSDSVLLLAELSSSEGISFDEVSGLVVSGSPDFVVGSVDLVPSFVLAPGFVDLRVFLENRAVGAGLGVVDVSVFALEGSGEKVLERRFLVLADERYVLRMPIEVDSGWERGNYNVSVSVSADGVEQASASKFLTVSGKSAAAPIFSVPEFGFVFLPFLVLAVLFVCGLFGRRH